MGRNHTKYNEEQRCKRYVLEPTPLKQAHAALYLYFYWPCACTVRVHHTNTSTSTVTPCVILKKKHSDSISYYFQKFECTMHPLTRVNTWPFSLIGRQHPHAHEVSSYSQSSHYKTSIHKALRFETCTCQLHSPSCSHGYELRLVWE